MHPSLQPALSAPIQIGEIGGNAVELDFWQERFLQLTERTLDLPFRFASRALHEVIWVA